MLNGIFLTIVLVFTTLWFIAKLVAYLMVTVLSDKGNQKAIEKATTSLRKTKAKNYFD